MPIVSGRRRSAVSLAIVLSSVSVCLAVVMLIAWIIVLVRFRDVTQGMAENTGLLVAGIISFAIIITVLVFFTVFLVRQIFEVRRQDTFIDSVTHELKSPLASLQLFLQALGRKELDPERREELRNMMLADVTRLGALIDTILAASRSSLSRRMQRRVAVSLRERVASISARVAQRRAVSLSVIHNEVAENVSIYCDPQFLDTCMDNLLDNAIKYSSDPPEVHVGLHEHRRWIEIYVQDRGIGIPKAERRLIFHRFYRSQNSAVRERHGTGLGLFIVWAMVRGMGGRVRAASEGEGKGSTFHVYLPRRDLVARRDSDRSQSVPNSMDPGAKASLEVVDSAPTGAVASSRPLP